MKVRGGDVSCRGTIRVWCDNDGGRVFDEAVDQLMFPDSLEVSFLLQHTVDVDLPVKPHVLRLVR